MNKITLGLRIFFFLKDCFYSSVPANILCFQLSFRNPKENFASNVTDVFVTPGLPMVFVVLFGGLCMFFWGVGGLVWFGLICFVL